MRPSIAENNKAHNEALAICEAFEKAGGKIKRVDVIKRDVSKSTINKKQAKR